jgi:antitoxin ParD1/3/4
MSRQSVTLTEGNNSWLNYHVESVGDYSNKSELINDLIRRARRAEAINQKLEKAENSHFIAQTSDEILAEFKSSINK